MISRLVAIVASAGLLLGLSACSTEQYPKEVVENYLTAINAVDPADKLNAQKYAVPGSDAEMYAIEQSAVTQAQLDGGTLDQTESELVFESDAVLLCVAGYDDPDVERDDFCSRYSNFTVKGDKLVTFDAGDKPLRGRIVLGSGESTPIGSVGSVKYLSSYYTIAGALMVAVEVTSNTEILNLPYDATYVAPNGRQVEVSMTDGPSELKSGRTGNVAYAFTGAKFGGTLELVFTDADWNEYPVSIPTT